MIRGNYRFSKNKTQRKIRTTTHIRKIAAGYGKVIDTEFKNVGLKAFSYCKILSYENF